LQPERRSEILSEELYDRSKIVRILLITAALPKVPTEACHAIQVAAFLIEENVLDTSASIISEAIATKLTPLLSDILPDLTPTKTFIDAIPTQQASTLNDLKAITSSQSTFLDTIKFTATTLATQTDQLLVNAAFLSENIDKLITLYDTPPSVDILLLAAAMDALGNLTQKQSDIAFKLEAASAKLFSPSSTISWPSIHSSLTSQARTLPLSNTFNTNFPPHFACTQQCLLQAARIVLILYDPSDAMIAQHKSPADLAILRVKINKALESLDDLETAFEDPPTKCNTIVSSIQHLVQNAFLLDMDSPETGPSVQEICARD